MAIYDHDGTTAYEIGKLYDYDGTTYSQQGKVYDYDGTTYNLLYQSDLELYNNGQYLNDFPNNWIKEWFNFSGGAFGGTCVVDNTTRANDIYMALAANGQYVVYNIYPNTDMNLSGYSKLKIYAEVHANYRFSFGIGYYDASQDSQYESKLVELKMYPTIWTTSSSNYQEYELDISDVDRSKLMKSRFVVQLTSSTNYGNSWVYIKKIWLE